MGQTALWKQPGFKISCRIPWRRWEAPSLRALLKPPERQALASKFVQEFPWLKAETRLHPSATPPRCPSCGTDPTPPEVRVPAAPSTHGTCFQHLLRGAALVLSVLEPQSWASTQSALPLGSEESAELGVEGFQESLGRPLAHTCGTEGAGKHHPLPALSQGNQAEYKLYRYSTRKHRATTRACKPGASE